MKTLNVITFTVCVSLIPLSSAGQDGTGLSQEDVKKINELSETFAQAVVSRDWKTVTALYVEEATLYPPGEAAVKGRAAIEACLAGLPQMTDFKLRTTKVEGRLDLAYVQGTYMMTLSPPGASKPVQESGYFLEIRRKQPDGRWRIAVHMLSAHE